MDRLREGARQVAAKLRERGHEAYLAGGSVRDLLRGVTPKDYDVVTDARPEVVARIFRRTVLVGAAFGVVRVHLDPGREYEVATYRADLSYSDGRHPDAIAYSNSKEEDVQRRDFTINALLMDPESGEVIDLVGGRADLAQRLVRAVGDPAARFAEDRLRMLRAIRFAARFGFTIEPATLAGIRAHAAALGAVSAERIVAELKGIFTANEPARGIALLLETGLWAAAMPAVPGDAPALVDRFARLAGAGVAPSPALDEAGRALVGFAAAFDAAGLDADGVEPELRRLKLSREEMRTIQHLLRRRALLAEPDASPPAALVRLVALDAEHPRLRAFQEVLLGPSAAPCARLAAVAADLAARPLPALPLVTGGDLKQLGLSPGPRFRTILERIEDEVLERRIATRDEALALAGALASAPDQ